MHLNLTLLQISSLLAIASNTFWCASAHALPPESPINASQANQIAKTLHELSSIDLKSVARVFEVKNSKGESIFGKRGHLEKEKRTCGCRD